MELTERHHKVWSLRLNLTQRAKTYPDNTLLTGMVEGAKCAWQYNQLKRLTDAAAVWHKDLS